MLHVFNSMVICVYPLKNLKPCNHSGRDPVQVYSSVEPFRLSPSAHLSPAAHSSGGGQSRQQGRPPPLQEADCGDVPTPRFTPAPGQTFSPIWASVDAPTIAPVVPSTASSLNRDAPPTSAATAAGTPTLRHRAETDTLTLQASLNSMGLAVAAGSSFYSASSEGQGSTPSAACSLSAPAGTATAVAATPVITSSAVQAQLAQQQVSGPSLSGLRLQLKGLGLNPHAAEFVLPTPRGGGCSLHASQPLQLQMKQGAERDVDRDGSQTARHDQNRDRELTARHDQIKDGSQTARGDRNSGRGRASAF